MVYEEQKMKCEHVGELGKSWQLNCNDDATKMVTVGIVCGSGLIMTGHKLCGKHGKELFVKTWGEKNYAKVRDLEGQEA